MFNFALNLEYMEAEYYNRGLHGVGLSPNLVGPNPGPVLGGRKVAFRSPWLRELFAEIAANETAHVASSKLCPTAAARNRSEARAVSPLADPDPVTMAAHAEGTF